MSAPTSWAWTIYDTNGTTVLQTFSAQNPSYTFPAAGSYFVRLIATNVNNVGSGAGTPSDTGLVAVPVTEPAAFNFVRTAEALISPGDTSAVIVVPIEVGNLVVVSGFSIDAPAINVPTASGITFAAVAAAQTLPNSTGKIRTFWGVATSGGSAVTVTAGLGGAMPAGTYGQLNVTQYVVQGTVSLLGHTEGSGTAAAGPIDPGPITASVGNVLLYGNNLVSNVIPTDAAGWTSRHTLYHFIADRMNLAAGTYRYQPTYAGSQDWIAQLVAFTTSTVPVDTPPTVAITAPTSSPTYPTAAATVALGGTASDDLGVVSVVWTNLTTGATGAAVLVGTTSVTWTVASIALNEGLNNLEARATDTTGQVTVDTLAVTRTTPPPNNPPTIAITSPTAAFSTALASIVMSGTATDDVAVTAVTWVNSRGGAGTCAVTGTTSATWTTVPPHIPLQPGSNTLTATAQDAAGGTASAAVSGTYTPPTPGVAAPPRFMRGFGAVRGAGTGDTIQTPLTAHSAARTWMFWARREETALPRFVFTKATQAIQSLTERFIAGVDGGSATRHFQRQFTGGLGDWYYYTTAPVGTRFHVAIAYDSSSAANVPTIWIDGVSQPIITLTQPTGTAVTSAAGYMLGNYPGGGGNWGGDLAKWTVYNRLCTTQEVIDHYEGDNPMTIGTAPVAYHVLDGTNANEPDAVTSTNSVVTGTLQQDYNAGATATIALSVTAGNPATGTPYQVTATVTGTVQRVEFTNAVTRTVTVAPYTAFVAPSVLGPGVHTFAAGVFTGPGGTAAATATLVVTEPSVTSGSWLVTAEVDRQPGVDSYKLYVDGSLSSTVLQPATGNPIFTIPFTGADTTKLFQYSTVTGGVESSKASVTKQYTDTSVTPVEGVTELARPYVVATTTWTPTYRWERKPLAVSYNVYLDGSLAANVLQPAGTTRPTYAATFTGAAVAKTVGLSAVFAGAVEGPRTFKTFQYTAPAADAPTGFQERSRTFTP